MLMKVFNKGQVVIPGDIRKLLNIHVGEMLDVRVDENRSCIELKKPVRRAGKLAGSLSKYAGKGFPSGKESAEALARGLSGEKQNR